MGERQVPVRTHKKALGTQVFKKVERCGNKYRFRMVSVPFSGTHEMQTRPEEP